MVQIFVNKPLTELKNLTYHCHLPWILLLRNKVIKLLLLIFACCVKDIDFNVYSIHLTYIYIIKIIISRGIISHLSRVLQYSNVFLIDFIILSYCDFRVYHNFIGVLRAYKCYLDIKFHCFICSPHICKIFSQLFTQKMLLSHSFANRQCCASAIVP